MTALAKLNASRALLTDQGAIFPRDLTFEEWLEEGRAIYYGYTKSLLWLGDWLNYGKAAYGEKYREAIKLTGYDPGTLRDAAWVASSVEMSRRRDNLSWSHHREVASLEPKEQVKYLRQAEENEWSKVDLRRAIRAESGEVKDKPGPRPDWSLSGWVWEGLRHLRQQINAQPIERWPAERRAAMKKELQPLVEIWEQL